MSDDSLASTPYSYNSMKKEANYLIGYLGRKKLPEVFEKNPWLNAQGHYDTEERTLEKFAAIIDKLDELYMEADRKVLDRAFDTLDAKIKEAKRACDSCLFSQVTDFAQFLACGERIQRLHLSQLKDTTSLNLTYPWEAGARAMGDNERSLREANFLFGILGSGMSNIMKDGKDQASVHLNQVSEALANILPRFGFEDVRQLSVDEEGIGSHSGIGTLSTDTPGASALGNGALLSGIVQTCQYDTGDTSIKETKTARAKRIAWWVLRPSHILLVGAGIAGTIAFVVGSALLGPAALVPATMALALGIFLLGIVVPTTLVLQFPFGSLIALAISSLRPGGNLKRHYQEQRYNNLLRRVMDGKKKAIATYKKRKGYAITAKLDDDILKASAAKEYINRRGGSKEISRMTKKALKKLIKLGKKTQHYYLNAPHHNNKDDCALEGIRLEFAERVANTGQKTDKLDRTLDKRKWMDTSSPYSMLKEIAALAAVTSKEDFSEQSTSAVDKQKQRFIANIEKIGNVLTTSDAVNLANPLPTALFALLKMQLLSNFDGNTSPEGLVPNFPMPPTRAFQPTTLVHHTPEVVTKPTTTGGGATGSPPTAAPKPSKKKHFGFF